jgi:hypothetical protein
LNNRPAQFYIDRNFEFFSPLDILATVFGLAIIFILIFLRTRRNSHLDYYKYYPRAFAFKAFFVMANCIFYIIVYGAGGDSIGFWDGAVKLNNLFWKDPLLYFSELFSDPIEGGQFRNFDSTTGYPDGHIYGEAPSFFISKIASVFTFVGYKGYILLSLIFAYITTNASWRLFELVRSYKLHSDRILAIAIFFIPSLSFWCGGISKDSFMWISVCYFLINAYQIISPDKQSSWRNWIVLLISLYVMYRVRSFMLLTVLAPLLFAYSARLGRKFGSKSIGRLVLRIAIIGISISSILLFFQTSIADEYIQEAAIINDDMTNNKTYGKNRYDLGITDYSPVGMALAFPNSVIAGVYRPYIWEALSVSLILNGIESVLIIFLTIRFLFSGRVRQRIRRIRNHEFLVFAFFFALILAYFAGFTSILFGVLVRFKAPLLPLLVIVLTSYYLEEKTKKNADSKKVASPSDYT